MAQFIYPSLFNIIPTTSYKITIIAHYKAFNKAKIIRQQEIVSEIFKFILNAYIRSGMSTVLMNIDHSDIRMNTLKIH